MLYESILDWET